jgi:hypothetical protein
MIDIVNLLFIILSPWTWRRWYNCRRGKHRFQLSTFTRDSQLRKSYCADCGAVQGGPPRTFVPTL